MVPAGRVKGGLSGGDVGGDVATQFIVWRNPLDPRTRGTPESRNSCTGSGFLDKWTAYTSGRPPAELLADPGRGHVPVPLEKPAVVVTLDEGPDYRSGLLEGFEVVQIDAL